MAYKYIIIADRSETSPIRGGKINSELYKISRPNPDPKDFGKYFLMSIEHNGKMALGFTDSDSLPVSNDFDVTVLKSILQPDAPQQELDMLEIFLTSLIGGRVYFKDIIPSGIQVYTEQEMIDFGFEIPIL